MLGEDSGAWLSEWNILMCPAILIYLCVLVPLPLCLTRNVLLCTFPLFLGYELANWYLSFSLSLLISIASFQDLVHLWRPDWGCNPSPLHGARGDNYSLSDSHISMKNAYSWGSKQLIKRLTLPHSCLCLQRGAFPTTVAATDHFVFSCCFVWVFSTLLWPTGGPMLCFPEVNFQSRDKPAVVCVVFCTSFLEQPSEYRFTAKWFWHEYIYSI